MSKIRIRLRTKSTHCSPYRGKKSKALYGLKAFKAILLDEFSYKYKGTKWQKYEKDVNEMRSLCYYRRERGLYDINPKWLPPLQ